MNLTWDTVQQMVRYAFAIIGTYMAVKGYPNEYVQMVTGALGPLVALIWWAWWEKHREVPKE